MIVVNCIFVKWFINKSVLSIIYSYDYCYRLLPSETYNILLTEHGTPSRKIIGISFLPLGWSLLPWWGRRLNWSMPVAFIICSYLMSSHNTRQKCHYFLGSCFCEEHFRSVYDFKIAIKNSVYCNVQALVLTYHNWCHLQWKIGS